MIRVHSRPHWSEVLLERSAVDRRVLAYHQGAENVFNVNQYKCLLPASKVEAVASMSGSGSGSTGTKSAAGSTGANEVAPTGRSAAGRPRRGAGPTPSRPTPSRPTPPRCSDSRHRGQHRRVFLLLLLSSLSTRARVEIVMGARLSHPRDLLLLEGRGSSFADEKESRGREGDLLLQVL
jgi:hypothetical protein